MAAELGVGYITLVPSAKGIVGGIQKELGAPAAAAGLSAGAKSSAGFASSFKKGIKQIAVPAAIIGGVVALGEQFEGAFKTIARGTGATGDTLKSLDSSFRTVLKSGAGSFDQVSAAVTTLYQRTGLTGKALDDFASKQVTLARITKTDITSNLQATTGLFNLFGVAAKDQSAALDTLFVASQRGGVSVTQLASDMQAAAPTAKALGLSIDQTAALTAGLERAGLPAGKVMLGLASAFAKAAKAGEDPQHVISDLVDEIKKAPTATAAATIATVKFGIGARQATTLVAGLRSGAINLNATLAGGKGILATAAATSTLSGKFAHLKNVALVGLEPLATHTLSAITRGVEDLTPAVGFLSDHMDELGPIIVAGTAAWVAYKTALGVKTLIGATTTGLTKLKDILFVQVDAQTAATAATEATAAASTESAVGIAATAGAATAAAAADVDLTASAATAAGALGAEAVAADGAATSLAATAAAGETAALATKTLALSTLGIASVWAVTAGAAVALGKTLYDLFAVSTKASINVTGATQAFAKGLLSTSTNAVQAKGSIDSLAAATKKWFDAQGAAREQTGGATIRNLGLSYHDVAAAVTGSSAAVDQFVARVRAARPDFAGTEVKVFSSSLHDLHDSLQKSAHDQITAFVNTRQLSFAQVAAAEAATKNADGTTNYVQALRSLGSVAATVTAAEGATTVQLQIQRREWTNLTTSIIGNTDALRASREGVLGIQSSSISAQQGLATVAAAQNDYNAAVKQFGPNSAQAHAALLTLKQDQISQAQTVSGAVDATEKWAAQQSGLTDALKNQAAVLKKSGPDSDAYAKATDAVTTAQGKFRDSLKAAAAYTKGPVHDALVQYLADTGNLKSAIEKTPAAKTITYKTPGLPAAVTTTHNFRGELDGLKSKSVTITVDASQALHALGNLKTEVHSIDPNIPLSVIPRVEGGRAAGGTIQPGTWAWTGERGPELAFGGASGLTIMSHANSMRSLLSSSSDVAPRPVNVDARTIVEGNVYGDSHLHRILDDHDRQLELALAAGLRR